VEVHDGDIARCYVDSDAASVALKIVPSTIQDNVVLLDDYRGMDGSGKGVNIPDAFNRCRRRRYSAICTDEDRTSWFSLRFDGERIQATKKQANCCEDEEHVAMQGHAPLNGFVSADLLLPKEQSVPMREQGEESWERKSPKIIGFCGLPVCLPLRL
jgi:hypothetical protein